MTKLNREMILNADDMEYETVDVPKWGGEITLKTLTGTVRDKFEASMIATSKSGQQTQNLDNLRARLIVLCAIDRDDNDLPIFQPEDIKALGKKSAASLDLVFSAAQKLNGFTKEDIDSLTEGFDSAQSESSTSE